MGLTSNEECRNRWICVGYDVDMMLESECLGTSGTSHPATWCHIPEENRIQLYSCENLRIHSEDFIDSINITSLMVECQKLETSKLQENLPNHT
jgi:hypothetical protein